MLACMHLDQSGFDLITKTDENTASRLSPYETMSPQVVDEAPHVLSLLLVIPVRIVLQHLQ